MAYNELFALAFVAPYVASEKKIPPTTVQEMMRRALYHVKWYFAMTDLNTDKGKAANKKSVVKYAKWYTPEKEAQYPTSFKVDFVGQPYEGACYYRITRCPICAYTEKLCVSERMPLFCEQRDHHLVRFAEQGHQLADAELFRVGADGTAGDAVIACARIRLTHEVHLEGRRVQPLLFRRVPPRVFHDAPFVFRLAFVRVQVGLCKVPFDVVQRAAHHLLHRLRRDPLPARDIRRDKGQREQLVIGHRIVIPDIVRLRDQLPVDRPALFHDIGRIRPAVLLGQNLLHGAFEHPEIKAVILHWNRPPA